MAELCPRLAGREKKGKKKMTEDVKAAEEVAQDLGEYCNSLVLR